MKPFLQSIAEAYFTHEKDALCRYCFVFPSRRSATFFTKYLSDIAAESGQPLMLPATQTVVDFVESFDDTLPAERMEMLFILFDEYRKVVAQSGGRLSDVDFNKFALWGDTLLSDFDDVDNALCSPQEIFRNVKNLKEIASTYLTPEQQEVVAEYFGRDKVPYSGEEFWQHIDYALAREDDADSDGDGPDKERKKHLGVGFLRLWQAMQKVYEGFNLTMKRKKLHSQGQAIKSAVEYLKEATPADLDYDRYIFVGFNNLSKAERAIFKRLQSMTDPESGMSMADFYWDIASPAFEHETFHGAKMVKELNRLYPSLYDCVDPIQGYPQIDVFGVPSRIGQAKAIGRVLDRIFPAKKNADGEKFLADPTANPLESASIVLPEETMVIPLLSALPQQISCTNLTMGLRLRNTAISGLIKDIIGMQIKAGKVQGKTTFYLEDVVTVLSNPLVHGTHHTECAHLVINLRNNREFNVAPERFNDFPWLAPIFTAIPDTNNPADVLAYLRSLLLLFTPEIDDEEASEASSTRIADAPEKSLTQLQHTFASRYLDAVDRLGALFDEYKVYSPETKIEKATVFSLIDKLILGETLQFEGKPLEGLQIMGILEARALDFDTIIIPSMNERVFPRAKYNASFIPGLLRGAYGLPEPQDQEGVYAYYFYRIISRAKRVILLYDARTTGMKTQMSRYIRQLKSIFKPENLRHQVLSYAVTSPNAPAYKVKKSKAVMRMLESYRRPDPNADEKGVIPLSAYQPDPYDPTGTTLKYRPGKGVRYLSASAIEQYASCPMSFYLERIMGFKREDDIHDWLDESVYGTIVHDVFEKIYNEQLKSSPEGAVITADIIDSIISAPHKIENYITRAINEFHLRKGKECYDEFHRELQLTREVIAENVRKVLEREKAFAPFTYLHSEWNEYTRLTFTNSEGQSESINLNCRIDRIDRCHNNPDIDRIRVIDYKTGGDDTHTPSFAKSFDDHKVKAFLQLMIYCQALEHIEGYTLPIQPMIFKLRTLMISDIPALTIGEAPIPDTGYESGAVQISRSKYQIYDYRAYRQNFNDVLVAKLQELFDENQPFYCTDDDNKCTYCAFREMCRREPIKF